MGQVFVKYSDIFLRKFLDIELISEILGKSARRVFRKLHCEPQFPKDARIVGVKLDWQVDRYDIIIESKSYPDVENPTELNLVCHNVWKEKEKVQFT